MTATVSSLSADIFFITLVLGVWFLVRRSRWNKRSRGQRMPPGPKGLPVIGNLLSLPREGHPWITYRDWSYQYGNIMSLDILRKPTVLLSSVDVTTDLLEKRSAIYSDRPMSTMNKLTGWDWHVGFMPYGQEWRSVRRIVHQYFNQSVTSNYRNKQTSEVHAFLRRLLEQQGEKLKETPIRLMLAGIILNVVYGMPVTGMDDPYIKLASKAMDVQVESNLFGAFWVEFIPFLKYLPSWAPGSYAVRYGARWRQIVMQLAHRGFDEVKDGKVNSMTSELITKLSNDGAMGTDAERHARYASGIAYAGKSSLRYTLSVLETFFSVMAMLPEVQKKAQSEIDNVVGRERLPSYEDHSSLPYVQAVILECLRWLPAGALGVPHRLTQDDWYGEYFLQEGTTVIPVSSTHLRAMLHNPEDYPDPEKFDPERFLTNGGINDDVRPLMIFGFGRRSCPGRHFALDTVFLTVASVLHAFNIEPCLDDNGEAMNTMPQATTGLISYPDRLNCMLKPRSDRAASLVRATQ
ncbi:cytochrome P450 [Trametopsis cervina]|nr:cytochrome P450 [Trametopsis cervina]